MVEASRSALGIDTSVPNIARMYDYWLGGKNNFAADREAAERMARAIPQLPWLARQNRYFLRRTVRFCAEEGVTQFLDIGSGLPTNQNVHEVAQQVSPDSHGCRPVCGPRSSTGGIRSHLCLPSRNRATALSMRRWRVSALLAALMSST